MSFSCSRNSLEYYITFNHYVFLVFSVIVSQSSLVFHDLYIFEEFRYLIECPYGIFTWLDWGYGFWKRIPPRWSALLITSFQEVHDIQLAMLTLFTRLRQMRCLKPTWYLESKVREAGSVGQVLNQIEGIQDELLNWGQGCLIPESEGRER